MTPNGSDTLQAAEVIQSMAAEAGFEVHIQAIEFAASQALTQQGDFEVYLNGWSGRLDIDGNTYPFLHSGLPNNTMGYNNATVDQLLEAARGMTDLGQRNAVYARMWPHLRQDLPITYLWTPRNIVGMSAKLIGFRPVPDGMIRLQGLAMGK